jgi:Na+/H+-dicarboxylate symporter
MKASYCDGSNILGLVLISVVFGIIISLMSEESKELLKSLNTITMIVTEFVIHMTPIAAMFLVLPHVILVEKLSILFQSLGWYTLIIMIGLYIHVIIILPLIYWMITTRNPFKFIMNMSSALTTAFGTASSSATIPVKKQIIFLSLRNNKTSDEILKVFNYDFINFFSVNNSMFRRKKMESIRKSSGFVYRLALPLIWMEQLFTK